MKNIFLILVAVFGIQTTVFCQDKICTDDLIGYWRCLDTSATELFFWKDVNGKLQVQEVSSVSGEPLDLITFRVDENAVFIRTFFEPKNFVTECTFTFLDERTLNCEVIGDSKTTLVYSKLK